MKEAKEALSEALGMPLGTAKNKLNKIIIFHLLKQLNRCSCSRCNREILTPNDIAIEHIVSCTANPDLYWDLRNVRICCIQCPQIWRDNKMNLISAIVVDENGNKLPTYETNGKTYIAGSKGERYGIKLSNLTSNRVEVVMTVDGLDVITGKPGDYKTNGGYVLDGYASTIIKGYRRNMDDVAAFRFTTGDAKETSYAGKKNMPENMGLIGIAVFKETRPLEWQLFKAPRQNYPWSPRIGGVLNYQESHDIVYGTTTDSFYKMSDCCSFVPPPPAQNPQVYAQNYSCPVPNIQTFCSTSAPQQDIQPEIGTKYGEVISQQCSNTYFTRENSNNPNELVVLYYDTHESLVSRGILPITQPVKYTPNAFPGVRPVSPGFAEQPRN